jgi:hypothetical protein
MKVANPQKARCTTSSVPHHDAISITLKNMAM